jgi:hypothetical protein
MHRILALPFFLLFLSVQAAPAASVEESLRQWRPNRRIQVTLNTGEKLPGRLGAIQVDRFVLEPDNKHATSRELTFDSVRSVKTKMTRTSKWLIAGAIYMGVTLLGLVNN